MKISSIEEVAAYQQCHGCGGCRFVTGDAIRMVDVEPVGIRPQPVRPLTADEQAQAMAICSGVRMEHTQKTGQPELFDLWGPVLAVYEGYATDETVRWRGSSGGATTALSLFAVESGRAEGVLHTRGDDQDAVRNRTLYSQSRESLLTGSGSRYAPSSPLTELDQVMQHQHSVVVGKPCDIATLHRIEQQRPDVADRVALKLAFFCAGVPSTRGNRDYIAAQFPGRKALVQALKFRGEGWPGLWRADVQIDGQAASAEKTYAESWGVLQSSRQWRCYICPDHSGEFADIALGDPWYREVQAGEQGSSLIVVRSQRGAEFLQAAVDAGYITLLRRDDSLIDRSQPNLIGARGGLWGRLLVLRLLGAPTPEYHGFEMFRFWRKLNFSLLKSSIVGTARRVFVKKLRQRQRLFD